MLESITVITDLTVHWVGIFSLEDLYKNIKYWLNINGYGDQEKNFREEKYVERIKGDSKQIEIRWKAEKIINDYVSYVINLSFNIGGLVEIELEKEGIRIKSNKGTLTIRIDSKLILDRKSQWKSDFIRNIYQKYIIKERIETHKVEIYTKTYELHNEIKSFLEIQR